MGEAIAQSIRTDKARKAGLAISMDTVFTVQEKAARRASPVSITPKPESVWALCALTRKYKISLVGAKYADWMPTDATFDNHFTRPRRPRSL